MNSTCEVACRRWSAGWGWNGWAIHRELIAA